MLTERLTLWRCPYCATGCPACGGTMKRWRAGWNNGKPGAITASGNGEPDPETIEALQRVAEFAAAKSTAEVRA